MLYVEQSLGPNEEILLGAHFHWIYTMQAVSWILFGIACGVAVGYGGIWWEVGQEIRRVYPNLPETLFDQAWQEVVAVKGGYLKILWGLHAGVRFGILGLFVMGLVFFTNMMVVQATTEIAVTTDRVIYKRGLIARHIGELNIDRIEGISVRQGILGRILGYGDVNIRGMGVGEVLLPQIDSPVELRKVIQEAKSIQEKSGNLKTTDDF